MTRPRLILSALLPFAAGYFMSYLLRAVNAVVAPDLVRDMGLTPAQLGLLTAAYLGAFALFQLPLGVLLDRYGPRLVQAGLLSVAALGCAAFALAPGFLTLFAARAVIGLGFSAGLMASYKSSATWVPPERRALANTAIMAVGAAGLVVATVPTQWLTGLIGWRNAFLVFAGLILAAALFILLAAPRKDTLTAPAPLRVQAAQLLAILKTPLFRRVAPLVGLTSGVQIGIQTLWAGPWLRDVMGFSREEVARHLLMMAVAFMIGILAIGVVADRLARRGIGPMPVMLAFVLLFLAAQAVLVLRVEGLSFPAWLLVAAAGQASVLAFPWFAGAIGPELAGRANAALNFTIFCSAFASQYLIGFIIGLFPATASGYSPQGYSWALGVFLAAQAVALIWYLAGLPRLAAATLEMRR